MYEIHIGLPKGCFALQQSLSNLLPFLKSAQAGESCTEPDDHSLNHVAHEVGGEGLHTLLTCRTQDIFELKRNAELAVRISAPNPDVRVEGEKLLFKTIVGGLPQQHFDLIDEHRVDFDGVRALPIPQFESHLSMTWPKGSNDASLSEAAQLAKTLNYRFHQLTKFPDKQKIVLTTFYPTVNQMKEAIHSLQETAIPTRDIRLDITAEQVLFCIAPIDRES